MNLSHFEQAVWHRWRPHSCPCETGDHGGEIVSPVEAVVELIEVARHMLTADRPISAGDRRLDVAEGCVGPLEGGRTSRDGSAPCDDDLMRTPRLGYATKAAQAVADHRTVRGEAGFGESGDRVGAKTHHTPELEANRFTVSSGLDRYDEWSFPLCTTSALAAGALTADVGVIDLDAPGQLLGSIAFEHDLRQLVFDFPYRGLGDAEAAAKFNAGDALLGLRHMIECAEPGAQRQLGRGEDRPGNRRSLQAAVAALKEVARGHHAVPLACASGAVEALRPAGCEDSLTALLLGSIAPVKFWLAEPFLELHRVAWVILNVCWRCPTEAAAFAHGADQRRRDHTWRVSAF